jgi:hypothetical protein
MIDNKLRAVGEQLGQRLTPVQTLEGVGLLDALPWQGATLGAQLIA